MAFHLSRTKSLKQMLRNSVWNMHFTLHTFLSAIILLASSMEKSYWVASCLLNKHATLYGTWKLITVFTQPVIETRGCM